MDYKLNLVTPCLYSKEGPSNCVDKLVEEFADYIRHRAYNEFNFRCNYNKIPGLAFIHSFEDFENRFLIHSEYVVIIASPYSQKALNQFVPRLLVFLTAKPIWQNRFLFICLGEVKILSNLVVNEPLQFSLNNWEAKDEESWKSLFNLIKITWKSHIEEECLGHTSLTNLSNPLIGKKPLKSNKENTFAEDQVHSKGEVKIFESKSTQGPVVTLEKFIFIGNDCKENKDKVLEISASVQTDNKYVEETKLLHNPNKSGKSVDYSNSSLESDENSDDNSEQTFECHPIIPQYVNPDIIEENDIELNSEMTNFFENLNNSHFENKNLNEIEINIINNTDDSGDTMNQTIGEMEKAKQNPSGNVMEDIDNQLHKWQNTDENDYVEKCISDATSCQGMLNRNSIFKGTLDNLIQIPGVELEKDLLKTEQNISPLHDNQDMTDSHNIPSKNNIKTSNDEIVFDKEDDENTKAMLVSETDLKQAYNIGVEEEKPTFPIFKNNIIENNIGIKSSIITSKNYKNNKEVDNEEIAALGNVNADENISEENLVPENLFMKENDFKFSITSKHVHPTEMNESKDTEESSIPYKVHSDANIVSASYNQNDVLKDSDLTSLSYYKNIDLPILHNTDDNNNNKLNENELELSNITSVKNDISKRIQRQGHEETNSLNAKLDNNKLVWKKPYLSDMISEEDDICKTEQKSNEMSNSINKLNDRLKWKPPYFSDVNYEEFNIILQCKEKGNNAIISTINELGNEKYNETMNFEESRKSNKDTLMDSISVVNTELCSNDDGINCEENKEREKDLISESNYKTSHELFRNNKFTEPVCNFAEEVGLIEKRENFINDSGLNFNEQEQEKDSISKSVYDTNVDLGENHKDDRDSYNSTQNFESMKNEKEIHANTIFNDFQVNSDIQMSPGSILLNDYSKIDSIPSHSSEDNNNTFSSNDLLNSHTAVHTVQLKSLDSLINKADSTSKNKTEKNELFNSDNLFGGTRNSEIKMDKNNIETTGKVEIKLHTNEKISKTSAQGEDQSFESITNANKDLNPLININSFTESEDITKDDFHDIKLNNKYSRFEMNTLQSTELDSSEKDTGYSEYSTQSQDDKTEDEETFNKDNNNNADISTKVDLVSKNENNIIFDKSKEFNNQKVENIDANLSHDSQIQLICLDESLKCLESSIEDQTNILETPVLSFEMINDLLVPTPNKWTPAESLSKETCLKENSNVKSVTTTNTYSNDSPIHHSKSIQEELNVKLNDSILDTRYETNTKEEFFKKDIKSEYEYYNPDECDKKLGEERNTLEDRDLIQHSTPLYHDQIENTGTSLRVHEENRFHLRSSFLLFNNTLEFAQYIRNLSRDLTFSVSNNIGSTILYGTRSFQNCLRNWFPRNSSSIAQSDESQLIFQRIPLNEILYSPWCVLLVFIAGTMISPYWVSLTNGYQRSGSSLIFMNPISLSVLQDENSTRKFPFMHRKFKSTFFAFGLIVYKKDSKK